MNAYLPVHTVPETTGEMDGSEGGHKWSKRKTLLMQVSHLDVFIADVSMAKERRAKPLKETGGARGYGAGFRKEESEESIEVLSPSFAHRLAHRL